MDDSPVHDGPDAGTGKEIRSNGMRFPLDPALLSRKQQRLLRQNLYEDKEYNAVRALARPEDVVIELGGGLGYLSTAAAVKRKIRAVHTYEANPRMIPYIEAVHRLNGVDQAVVTNAALGPAAGMVKYYIRQEFPDSSMTAEPAGDVSPVVAVEEVPMVDIAAEFARIRPSFLICDIEGAEAELLPLADLSSLRCAVVELHPQWIGRAGVQAVFDAMKVGGLTFYPRTSIKKVATFRRDW